MDRKRDYTKESRKLGRTCSNCGVTISDRSTTGLCRKCYIRQSDWSSIGRGTKQ